MVSYLFTDKYQTQNNHNFLPSSNGIVERFHRQLKNSLRPGSSTCLRFYWVYVLFREKIPPFRPRKLSMVLSQSSHISSWQLNILLPTTFMKISETPCPVSVLFRLVTIFRQLQISWSSYRPFSCPAQWFLWRNDGHVPPLAPFYAGPYSHSSFPENLPSPGWKQNRDRLSSKT